MTGGGFQKAMDYANTTSNGVFGLGILISFWVIMYISFKRWGDMEAVLVATFMTTVLAGMFRALNVITDMPFVVCLVLTGAFMLLQFRRTQ